MTVSDSMGTSAKDQALWMLDRMRESEAFLAETRGKAAAGTTGLPAVFVASDQERLKDLYQSPVADTVELPAAVAGAMDMLAERDLMSCREELVERMIAAYIERHPRGAEGLPQDWQTTIEAARAEVEGHTSGAFDAELVTRLADDARREQAQRASYQQAAQRGKGNEPGR